MYGNTHRIRRMLTAIALSATAALIAIPAGQARNTLVDDWFRDAQPQNTLVDDYFRDAQPQNTLVDDYFREVPMATVAAVTVPSAGRGIPPAMTAVSPGDRPDWGKIGIGMGIALGTIVLLGALRLGARQARHGRQRLGSA